MQHILTVTIKHVYGKPLVYPVSDNAKLFAKMLQVKTFNKQQLDIIKQLGFDIQNQNKLLTIDEMFS